MAISPKHKRIITLSVLLAAIGITVWFLLPDRQLAKVMAMSDQLVNQQIPAAEQRKKWQQLREEMQKLSPGQREKLSEERRKGFRKRLTDFFDLPPAERTAYLDKQIDDMEAWRKQREQARTRDSSSPAVQSGFGRGNMQSLSDEEKERRRKQRLDRTTPEDRAMRTQFFRAMNDRRTQRGLPPLGGWR